jgi:8-oxo-dGTP pyrophosphatase MutT (NUDIX family)
LSSWLDLDRELVRRSLEPLTLPEPHCGVRAAAVSVLLAAQPSGVELLLIRRAQRPSDPWSGHMAFPGGHRDDCDQTLLRTAIRETREEIGLDLERHAELLGVLDDVSPVTPRALLVRPFVFALAEIPELAKSPEVDVVTWARMGELAGGANATEYELHRDGQSFRFPAFRVEAGVVWGLTYRVLGSLLSRVAAFAPSGVANELRR